MDGESKGGALVERGRAKLSWISLTGAEDSVDPRELARLSREHPRTEWAILAMAEAEGIGRNPSAAWRGRFLDAMGEVPAARSAIHLCGVELFERVLARGPWEELSRCSRVQANLNARGEPFGRSEALAIWSALAEGTRGLVIQLHAGVEGWAREFLEAAGPSIRGKVELLFDESKGRGAAPEAWRGAVPGVRCGWAGGLGPGSLAGHLPAIAMAAAEAAPGSWIDMESALRTGGLFDLAKCARAIELARPWLQGPAVAAGAQG